MRGGDTEVKRVAVVVLAMALLMLCTAFAPVFAAPQPHGTFEQVIITLGGGEAEEWLTGDVLHQRGGEGTAYLYGAPFPLGNSLSAEYTNIGQLNVADLTGSFVGHTTADNFAAGTMVGSFVMKFTGMGPYVYTGPTFTFELGGMEKTVTSGHVFFGLLFDIQNYRKHGVGDLTGFVTKGDGPGVIVVNPADPMVGFGVSVVTGTYSGP